MITSSARTQQPLEMNSRCAIPSHPSQRSEAAAVGPCRLLPPMGPCCWGCTTPVPLAAQSPEPQSLQSSATAFPRVRGHPRPEFRPKLLLCSGYRNCSERLCRDVLCYEAPATAEGNKQSSKCPAYSVPL